MLWKIFFVVCYALCGLIPTRSVRENIRTNKLFDWRNKFNAVRDAFPNLNYRGYKIIKGGWNIGFIIDNKFVFKFRKRNDANSDMSHIIKQKRITDAFADISPLKIPHIDIIESEKYTFYKYDFIAGKNLNTYSQKFINNHARQYAKTLAGFIYSVHNARPKSIDDLRVGDGDGWNQHDICNNIIINPKSKKIVAIIDWEYAGWGLLETEIKNAVMFSKKMRASGIKDLIVDEYNKLKKHKVKK